MTDALQTYRKWHNPHVILVEDQIIALQSENTKLKAALDWAVEEVMGIEGYSYELSPPAELHDMIEAIRKRIHDRG